MAEIQDLEIKVHTTGAERSVKRLKELQVVLGDLRQTSSGLKEVSANVGTLSTEFSDAKKEAKATSSALSEMAKKEKEIQKLKQATEKLGKEAKKSSGFFGKLGSSILRIGFYRMIRTAMKEISEAFKEGFNNLYQWSKLLNGSFAKALDSIASKGSMMKNQLGASLGTLIESLRPAIEWLISGLTRVFELLTMVISGISGKSTYYKATQGVKEYAKAVDNAKKSLAGFDEINNIGGSKSGQTSDVTSGTFEEAFLPEQFRINKDFFENLSANLKLTVNDVFFEWKNLNEENVTEKMGALGGTLFGAVIGGALFGPVGGVFGAVAGLSLSLLASASIFDHDGSLSDEEKTLTALGVGGTLLGTIVGGALFGPIGALLGASIGFTLTIGLETIFKLGGETEYAKTRKQLKLEMEALGIDAKEAARLGLTGTEEDMQIIYDNFGEWGVNVVQGYADGLEEERKNKKSIWENFCTFLGNLFKTKNDINSPSKLFEGFGKNIVQGLTNGVDGEKPILSSHFTTMMNNLVSGAKTGMTNIKTNMTTKWNEIKTWWQGLELPSFKIKTPHISWSTTEASGWIAKTLSALGIPTQLPKMQVSWYDVGTNYVSHDQLAMVHKGEAIIPAKYNQDPAYSPNGSDETNELLRQLIEVVANKDMNAYIDGDSIGKASVNYINRQSRILGGSLL